MSFDTLENYTFHIFHLFCLFQFSHNFSGKMNPDGSIAGIPEPWKKRLQLMITAEEAENPEIAEKARQLFKEPLHK